MILSEAQEILRKHGLIAEMQDDNAYDHDDTFEQEEKDPIEDLEKALTEKGKFKINKYQDELYFERSGFTYRIRVTDKKKEGDTVFELSYMPKGVDRSEMVTKELTKYELLARL